MNPKCSNWAQLHTKKKKKTTTSGIKIEREDYAQLKWESCRERERERKD